MPFRPCHREHEKALTKMPAPRLSLHHSQPCPQPSHAARPRKLYGTEALAPKCCSFGNAELENTCRAVTVSSTRLQTVTPDKTRS